MIQELFGRENPNDEETASLDKAGDVAALKLKCINEFKIFIKWCKVVCERQIQRQMSIQVVEAPPKFI